MGEEKERVEPDTASQVGRAAGAAASALGRRLLRLRSVREAVRRAKQEAEGGDHTTGQDQGAERKG